MANNDKDKKATEEELEEIEDVEVVDEEEDEEEERKPRKKIKKLRKVEKSGWEKFKTGVKLHWKKCAVAFAAGAGTTLATMKGVSIYNSHQAKKKQRNAYIQEPQQNDASPLDPNY